MWHGRGADNRVVNFPAWGGIESGELVRMEVTGASPHALLGRRRQRSNPGEHGQLLDTGAVTADI